MVKFFFVVGDQASKSLSPLIFSHWFKKYNIKAKYSFLEVTRKNFDSKIVKYSKTLQSLENDTESIVDYVENTFNKDKKKYKFWELIIDNDK